jgi:hypothetical protein
VSDSTDIQRIVRGRGRGRGRRTVSGKLNSEKKHSAVIRAAFRTHDGRLPLEQIITLGACAAIGRGVALQILQLSANAFLSHLKKLCVQFDSVKAVGKFSGEYWMDAAPKNKNNASPHAAACSRMLPHAASRSHREPPPSLTSARPPRSHTHSSRPLPPPPRCHTMVGDDAAPLCFLRCGFLTDVIHGV